MDLTVVNAVAELELLHWTFEVVGENAKLRCPAHADEKPSASLNLETGAWNCFACKARGDVADFIAHAKKETRQAVILELSKRYDIDAVKTVDADFVERAHLAIWQSDMARKPLYDRGLTDALIRKYRLGYSDGRITIPVTDAKGRFINVRKYLPGAPGDEKMRNVQGRSAPVLFPVDQLRYNKIIVTGGECKAIVTADKVNELGWGAVTVTAAEGVWDAAFTAKLEDKFVAVIMDVDEHGIRASHSVCAKIRVNRKVLGVKNVSLPLDTALYPKGDLNDYFAHEKRSGADLVTLIELTQMWDPQAKASVSIEHAVHLTDVSKPAYADKRVRTAAVISAISENPYLVPRSVECSCDRSQKFCPVCPVYTEPQGKKHAIPSDDKSILEMVDASIKAQEDALKTVIGIPLRCKVVTFKTHEYHRVEDMRLSSQLTISTAASDRAMQRALYVGNGVELNAAYEIGGRMLASPRDQTATLLVDHAKTTIDALSAFAPSKEDIDELRVFQRGLDAVYEDLEANVTRIFHRRNLHLLIDLVYHSPLVITLDGRETKGWVEALIIGDSAQGKTEASNRLKEHYGLGERVVCKNASVPGLLGGVQPIAGKWFVTWGVIPQHDRRLVILEELKGASTEVIGKLTDMRSSGIAEIPKIERRRTFARTRLLAISNARSDQSISAYNYGVHAVHELMGSLEDVRRFDAVIIATASQVDAETISRLQRNRPQVKHSFTSELCRRLVLWAWTRRPEQVIFTCDEQLSDAVDMLTKKYDDSIPLIDRGSARSKLARLSAAYAARVFSTDDGERLIVKPEHVDFVVKFLDELYSDPACGYADYSQMVRSTNTIADPKLIKRKIMSTPYPADMVESLLSYVQISLNDISDWTGWDRAQCVELLSFFVRKHALKRAERAYVKTTGFAALLRELKKDPDLHRLDRPEHIPTEEM